MTLRFSILPPSAPIEPHFVHARREPNDGTPSVIRPWRNNRSALAEPARDFQGMHPSWRMLPGAQKAMKPPGKLRRLQRSRPLEAWRTRGQD